MITREVATVLAASAALVLVIDWLGEVFNPPEPQCYVQIHDDPIVATWMDCDEVVSPSDVAQNFKNLPPKA